MLKNIGIRCKFFVAIPYSFNEWYCYCLGPRSGKDKSLWAQTVKAGQEFDPWCHRQRSEAKLKWEKVSLNFLIWLWFPCHIYDQIKVWMVKLLTGLSSTMKWTKLTWKWRFISTYEKWTLIWPCFIDYHNSGASCLNSQN